MQRNMQWGGDKGGVEWREVKVVCGVKGAGKVAPCWCGALGIACSC